MDQDFDSCFALKCDQCRHQCCGWCLRDCGSDAHPHVRQCNLNGNGGNLFPPAGRSAQAVFLEAQRGRRRADIQRYLAAVDSDAVRAKVALLMDDGGLL